MTFNFFFFFHVFCFMGAKLKVDQHLSVYYVLTSFKWVSEQC